MSTDMATVIHFLVVDPQWMSAVVVCMCSPLSKNGLIEKV